MIDRLPELKKNLAITNESMSDNQLNNQNPYEQNVNQNQEGIDDQFIQDIKSVRQMISALKNNNIKIQSIKGKYAKAIKSAQEHQNSDEMNQILSKNYKLNQGIKEKLISIQKQVKEAEKNQKDEPETRMKRNFYLSLTKQVADTLEKQQQFESQYKNTVKDKVTRQVRLIDKDITQQQMEQYVNDPNLAQQMLQKKIYGQASITLKNTVSDIQDKFRDIQKLQASVNQCVQLFNELATLVQAQGEKIDSIQAHVVDTKDYVGKAQTKLKKAKQHHQCSKKCLCIGIVVGLVILIVVIIIVVATKK